MGHGQPCRKRKAGNAAGAAKAKDRNPVHVITKPQLAHHPRLDGGRGNAGGRNHHDGVDLVGRQSGLFKGPARNHAEKMRGPGDEGFRTLRPALFGAEPVIGTRGIAHVDARIGIDRHHPVKILLAAAEDFGGFDDDLFGPEFMLGNGGGKAQQFGAQGGVLVGLFPYTQAGSERFINFAG